MTWQELPNRFLAQVVRPTARPAALGVVVALGFILAEILLVLGLKRVAPDNAFGAVFLLGVLVVSAGWGFGLALATSVASALVYVYFHIEGRGSLVPAIAVFLTLALLTNVLVGQARLRAAEAEQRRREADLSAALARVMLRAPALGPALDGAGKRFADVLGLPFAILRVGGADAEGGQTAVALVDGSEQTGTLLVPVDLTKAASIRVHRMLPSLQALLAAACDREQITHEVTELATQQAALRRVATLVARGADPTEVYQMAVEELAHSLEVEHVTLLRFETGDHCVVLAARDHGERPGLRPGERFSLDGDSISAQVLRTSAPGRIDDYATAEGPIAARMNELGIRSGAGVPIIVGGSVRGALIVGFPTAQAIPARTEAHIGDFADLIATAIANAETRAELTASRARIVAAADQARRGFERDLHDGAQQRIVSLSLELRGIEASVLEGSPDGPDDLRGQLSNAVRGLAGLHSDLQELSRGMHPAILSKGGLGAAIKTLARRSKVPVELDLQVDRRLPESVEVAAYYIAAESLTNTAKYANASYVAVQAVLDANELRLSVTDDGVGGATPGGGSGLVGLKDRVEALSGKFAVISAPGGGTSVTATIPVPLQ